MSNDSIPFLDLVTPHRQLEEELVASVREALRSAAFIGGGQVESFEKEFAAFCGTKYSVGVANGTDAVRFALMAAGVKAGETVVTVPNTFIATTEAISQAGGRIAFVDVDARTYTMDPEKLRAFVERQCTWDTQAWRLVHTDSRSVVSAIVPVHLYGQMADMDSILELAAKYNLRVVEDACQAHGAEYFSRTEQRWRKAGSMGVAAAFSFYPGKNLGACGEAGAVTTNDERVAAACRMIRDHGQSKKYYHDIEGYNGRLDAIQAGFLRVKLRHLEDWNDARGERAQLYGQLLAGSAEVALPYVPSWSKPVFHLYVIQVADRERLQRALGEAGIGTGIHYPIPLHLQKAYDHLGCLKGSFPVSEAAAVRQLSLPMFPTLTADAQRLVAERIREFVGAVAQTASGA
ncbi:MAG TPA: DegT/DnrJ/EryC1/StrS family aminotransferase [Gemmatimonadaceae bacterium]